MTTKDSKPDINANNLAHQHRLYIERRLKLTPTKLQEIHDRVRWANNVHAQLDSPQEPTQPPLNPEIILEDENEQENGAAQQTPKDKKMKKKIGKPQ